MRRPARGRLSLPGHKPRSRIPRHSLWFPRHFSLRPRFRYRLVNERVQFRLAHSAFAKIVVNRRHDVAKGPAGANATNYRADASRPSFMWDFGTIARIAPSRLCTTDLRQAIIA